MRGEVGSTGGGGIDDTRYEGLAGRPVRGAGEYNLRSINIAAAIGDKWRFAECLNYTKQKCRWCSMSM